MNATFFHSINDTRNERIFKKVYRWLKDENLWIKEIYSIDNESGLKKFDIFLKYDPKDNKGIHIFFCPMKKDLITIVVNITLDKNDRKSLFALPPSIQDKLQSIIETTIIQLHIGYVYEYDPKNSDIFIILYKVIYFDNLSKDLIINNINDLYQALRIFEGKFDYFINSIVRPGAKDNFN